MVCSQFVNISKNLETEIKPLSGGFITGMVCKGAQTKVSHVEMTFPSH